MLAAEDKAQPPLLQCGADTVGAGGLLGSAITPTIRRRVPVGWHMVGVIVAHGLGIALVALSSSAPLAMAGMALVGAAEAMTSIVQVSYRLAMIPDSLQGRVNSVYRLGSFSAMTLGTALVGLMIEATDPRAALWIVAAYVLALALGVALSEVRRL